MKKIIRYQKSKIILSKKEAELYIQAIETYKDLIQDQPTYLTVDELKGEVYLGWGNTTVSLYHRIFSN